MHPVSLEMKADFHKKTDVTKQIKDGNFLTNLETKEKINSE